MEDRVSKGKAKNTRQRIIEAAGRIFAESGFHKATVRGICGRAGVNVALVAYHFGGKEGLYREVLAHALNESLSRFPPDMGDIRQSPEERLYAFVRAQMERIAGVDRRTWGERLLRREFFETSPAMEDLMREAIKPMAERLGETVGELLDLPPDDEAVTRCCLSVVGQCLHHYLAAPTIGVLYPNLCYDRETIEGLAEHITRFSLGGIREARDQLVSAAATGRHEGSAARRQTAALGS